MQPRSNRVYWVLILVLMEDILGDIAGVENAIAQRVLILVLMEDTLGEGFDEAERYKMERLNPCSNGRYSRRRTFWKL